MNGRRRTAAIVFRVVSALAIAAAPAGFAAPRASAAQQESLSLTYDCDFPVINQVVAAPVQISTDIPDSIGVGQSTAHYAVDASATGPALLATGLAAFGVAYLTGTVDGQADVEAPQGDFTETVHLDIAEITVSAFSSFTGTATGEAPEVTFGKPGQGRILVGDLTIHLTPLDSNGAVNGLGELTVPCTPAAGQNDVVSSFTVTAPASAPATPAATRTTAGAATSAPGPASTKAAASPSAGPSQSSSTSSSTSSSRSPSSSPGRTPSGTQSSAGALGAGSGTGTSASEVAAESAAHASAPHTAHSSDAWAWWLGGLALLAVLAGVAVRWVRRGPGRTR